jgi:nucleotide-binding universal stress UspA family protein
MYERILVPTDGSESAAAAVEHGLDLAKQYDAELHVLFVADTRRVSTGAPAVSPSEVKTAMENRGAELTKRVAERAQEAGIDVVTAVREGAPDETIRTYAEEESCDLIVMGTHGRTGLERYLLGSVTERTLRRARVPVLTVRAEG